ncbi:hypothetical protein ACSYAD_30630 [Acaryochloris marina NIES-2412]|uniref:hypothetical protein n=1 Tax=Acaryochloris marina TaxID=155978 RepID=UPI0040581841
MTTKEAAKVMAPTKAFYNGTPIAPPSNHLTTEQKLDLLDWHPVFTGRCPNCERPIRETTPPLGHWDCAECGWGEESG